MDRYLATKFDNNSPDSFLEHELTTQSHDTVSLGQAELKTPKNLFSRLKKFSHMLYINGHLPYSPAVNQRSRREHQRSCFP